MIRESCVRVAGSGEARGICGGRGWRLLVGFALMGAVVGTPAWGVAQTDDFELKPMWSPRVSFGEIGVSSEARVSGNTALRLASKPGGQRDIALVYRLPAPAKGKFEVKFNDTAPGRQTLYSGLRAYNSRNYTNENSGVNVADWNPSNYVWAGPGIGQTPTTVPRRQGWHSFTIELTESGFSALIDGTVVGQVYGNFAFDTVELFLSGPYWRPDAAYLFDDFRYSAPGAAAPTISFSSVPPYGSFADLMGRVTNVAPSQYRVAVFIRVAGRWWTKPTFASPLTVIQPDGSWTADITTGGQDQLATDIVAYLVPASFAPPLVGGAGSLPAALDANAVAKAQVTRNR